MKKIFTLLFTILWLCTSAVIARTPQEAAQAASNFFAQHNPTQKLQQSHNNTLQPVELTFTQYQVDATTPAVYIFNAPDEQGFVLVAAEDHARTILGYADHGTLDANNIPANMQFWLQMYADEMRREGDEAMRREGDEAMRRVSAEAMSYPTIEPLLGELCWGQTRPYNDYCPTINSSKAPTGCAATAIAQIMYHHQYPTQGSGSHTYTSDSYGLELGADFGATTYDWANMLTDYSSTYTPAQSNAVATLMYHLGVASNMDYTPATSGTTGSAIMRALTKNFGYDKAIQTLPKDYLNEEDLLTKIANDLQAGRPVFMQGMTVNNEGHAFVCDGMQNDGYLHINWGWNGMGNGHFAVSALDPEQQGVGGSASNMAYTQDVIAYTGIQPDQGNEYIPLLTASTLKRSSSDQIGRSSSVKFDLSILWNRGLNSINGTLCYLIYNQQGDLVEAIDVYEFDLDPTYYYKGLTLSSSIPTSLSSGQYQIEVGYRDQLNRYQSLLVKGIGTVRTDMTVTSDYIYFDETPEAEKPGITHADFKYVSGTNQWDIDLYTSGFWDNTPATDEQIIRCSVHNNSSTSVIGSYAMHINQSNQEATIQSGNALYAIGYAQACYQYTPTNLQLTITQDEQGNMQVQYYMEVNGKVYQQNCKLSAVRWIIKQNGANYYYDSYITYELASALSASSALELIQNLPNTEETAMAYFVRGVVSNMRNTPEEISQYKSARFDISDDGSTDNQLYCYNTRWLNNTDFTTGKEIQTTDQVVIYGHAQNYQGTTPEIKGYVYKHIMGERPNQTDVMNVHGYGILYLYDIMGRLVDTKTSSDPRPWHVPATGIYMQTSTENTQKVYIQQ